LCIPNRAAINGDGLEGERWIVRFLKHHTLTRNGWDVQQTIRGSPSAKASVGPRLCQALLDW
jgi:hypothetical protein